MQLSKHNAPVIQLGQVAHRPIIHTYSYRPMQDFSLKDGGWAYNAVWAYNTYFTVYEQIAKVARQK